VGRDFSLRSYSGQRNKEHSNITGAWYLKRDLFPRAAQRMGADDMQEIMEIAARVELDAPPNADLRWMDGSFGGLRILIYYNGNIYGSDYGWSGYCDSYPDMTPTGSAPAELAKKIIEVTSLDTGLPEVYIALDK
jgi:hypothetical protein